MTLSHRINSILKKFFYFGFKFIVFELFEEF